MLEEREQVAAAVVAEVLKPVVAAAVDTGIAAPTDFDAVVATELVEPTYRQLLYNYSQTDIGTYEHKHIYRDRPAATVVAVAVVAATVVVAVAGAAAIVVVAVLAAAAEATARSGRRRRPSARSLR